LKIVFGEYVWCAPWSPARLAAGTFTLAALSHHRVKPGNPRPPAASEAQSQLCQNTTDQTAFTEPVHHHALGRPRMPSHTGTHTQNRHTHAGHQDPMAMDLRRLVHNFNKFVRYLEEVSDRNFNL
jgi:hypothetical protein